MTREGGFSREVKCDHKKCDHISCYTKYSGFFSSQWILHVIPNIAGSGITKNVVTKNTLKIDKKSLYLSKSEYKLDIRLRAETLITVMFKSVIPLFIKKPVIFIKKACHQRHKNITKNCSIKTVR